MNKEEIINIINSGNLDKRDLEFYLELAIKNKVKSNDIKDLSELYILDEDFIENYKKVLNPFYISKYQILSCEFIKKNLKWLDIPSIISYQKLDNEIISYLIENKSLFSYIDLSTMLPKEQLLSIDIIKKYLKFFDHGCTLKYQQLDIDTIKCIISLAKNNSILTYILETISVYQNLDDEDFIEYYVKNHKEILSPIFSFQKLSENFIKKHNRADFYNPEIFSNFKLKSKEEKIDFLKYYTDYKDCLQENYLIGYIRIRTFENKLIRLTCENGTNLTLNIKNKLIYTFGNPNFFCSNRCVGNIPNKYDEYLIVKVNYEDINYYNYNYYIMANKILIVDKLDRMKIIK